MSSMHNNIEINVSEEARKKLESLKNEGHIPNTTTLSWNNLKQTSSTNEERKDHVGFKFGNNR